ncbi:alpha-L-rhamnosidase N-terminal domain-containing protein [Terrimicrobium sacchariphilum]|uniref:Alpha-L-rhamnosidase N-terminal domain-containing protein n=1 Tax=Terrimicrobium sacchariphilum TaxID=690879 RepID=A0A146G5I0_TERSA|nr:alpha-L-rhamnosidase C-terminal domain-containing protein [Terrimicrobium sacchariphilum]GAT33035.1 alpha-L-rhamnosidase N-terminal domain-containing protein [Terrimicrobium sacchariphilum]
MSAIPSTKVPDIITKAFWIWPDSLCWDLGNCYALFRKSFSLKSLPRKAPFYITADQSYQLYINGRYVCRGPARGFQHSWPYDEVDVREWLRKGRNVIAVRAYNPGRSNFQYLHQGYAGLLVAARWGGVEITTDKSWSCRRQRGVNRATVPTSLQLFPQEDIDLRLEDPGWMLPGFQEDETWTPHEYGAAVWNSMPWASLEERGLPMLDEALVPSGSCIGQASGRSMTDWRVTRNLAINRYNEGLGHESCTASAEKSEFLPVRKGGWRSLLIDFGKVVVGSVILSVEGASGGECVETFHTETIDPEKLEPHFLPEAHCRMAFAHRLTCRPGGQEHQFFHPFGFRYLVLTVRENPGTLRVGVSLRTAVYPLEQKGSFQSSEGALEKIWEACAWTERICSMDAYVDTPWREQAQWWGDARVQAWNTFHLSGDARLLHRGIRQVGAMTTPTGITYGHAPTMAHNCILPDFTLIWMATLWDEYWQTGSIESFLVQQGTIASALAYFEEWTNPETGLLKYDQRYWLFLDWTDIQKDGESAIYSFWLLYALDRLSTLYSVAGQRPAAARCRRWAMRVRRALLGLQGKDGLISDGIRVNGRRNAHCSVHAQTLALMNRLSPRHDSVFVEKSLLPFLRGELKSEITPSAYWITYVYTELASRGYGAEVVADIEKRWQEMAEFGTTFEGFHGELGNGSRSHAWSAHPLFHLMQILGGVRQSAPGWSEITFEPVIVGSHASTKTPSPHGLILAEWRRGKGGDHVQGSLTLPAGVKALIRLPDQRPHEVDGPCRYRFTAKVP